MNTCSSKDDTSRCKSCGESHPPLVMPGPTSRFGRFIHCMRQFGLCCWITCCPPWPSCIIRKLAFRPPPSTYTMEPSTDDLGGYTLKVDPKRVPVNVQWAWDCVEGFKVPKQHGSGHLAAFYYHCSRLPLYTILYSHANAQDIGSLIVPAIYLAEMLCCDVCAYDYSGYGQSTGSATESNLYRDIHCVFNEVLRRFLISPENIILYGQSIGTVPTVDLATKVIVKGVVLHSPPMSAMSVLMQEPDETCLGHYDTLRSIDKIHQVKSPCLVIHGTEDEVVHVRHGIALYEKCATAVSPLWVNGGHHNDLDTFPEYYHRLLDFIHISLAQLPSIIRTDLYESLCSSEENKKYFQASPETSRSKNSERMFGALKPSAKDEKEETFGTRTSKTQSCSELSHTKQQSTTNLLRNVVVKGFHNLQ